MELVSVVGETMLATAPLVSFFAWEFAHKFIEWWNKRHRPYWWDE